MPMSRHSRLPRNILPLSLSRPRCGRFHVPRRLFCNDCLHAFSFLMITFFTLDWISGGHGITSSCPCCFSSVYPAAVAGWRSSGRSDLSAKALSGSLSPRWSCPRCSPPPACGSRWTGRLLGVVGVRVVAVRTALLRVELDIHRGMEALLVGHVSSFTACPPRSRLSVGR